MIYIKDMTDGSVRPYGTNRHDALHLSPDGRTITYDNLQNGDGSKFGDYRLCDNPEGILPEDIDSPEAVYTYVDIGGSMLQPKKGTWIDVPCKSDLLNPTGIDNKCPFCGWKNSYGQPPFCMYCGAQLEKSEGAKERKRKLDEEIEAKIAAKKEENTNG